MKKLLLLFMCLLLSACAEKEILDDITIVRTLGFDKASKKNEIKGTINYPIFINEQTFKMKYLTASGETSKEIRNELNEMTAKPIFIGKLNTILFSEKLAKEGIMETLDTLQRDPGVGRAIYLGITKQSAKHILSDDYNYTNSDGNYFSNLIKQNENFSNLPLLNFHTFLYAYFADSMDPVLPYLSKQKDAVKIIGLAIFKKDKMVGTIDEQQILIFKTLFQDFKEGSFQFSNKAYKGNLEILKSHLDIKIIEKPYKRVRITVDVKGRLTEYTKVNAGDPKVVKSIEKTIKKELEHNAQKLTRKFQKLNIDPLGIGEHVRSQTRGFNLKQYKDQYQDMDIEVVYHLKITESGVSQ
ncbi:Ger(x)C family spore germination protein [Fictibacillus phosphorivorans]|uniref:Ger(x)C family spore germination protein n=1 Tax=Fictibacillus phosphorivorans TaxID=1221500 RepID=UPI00203AF679|nr:Ger(x)C family spore germination protein [Fictibacillus phosphorivorans]MCM3718742.1 Ger(x)C family spore germination protein [Fictibacillus phosphorivorans]MCM3776365.1 Ger(x)C family spore germination protein [Fictibacillus phosphorivorans]